MSIQSRSAPADREDGMLTFRNGLVAFDAYDKLIDFADFDPAYLDQAGRLLG